MRYKKSTFTYIPYTGSTCAIPQTWLEYWTGHVSAITNSSFTKLCCHEPTNRSGRHRTLVADLPDDINHVCNFVSQDSSLPHNREEGSSTMPAHCSWYKPVILDVSGVPTVTSHTSPEHGTRNTSANALSAHWSDHGLTSTSTTNTAMSYKYYYKLVSCLLLTEIPTCDVNNGGCCENARCIQTELGPSCHCKEGFEGDGKTCEGKC